MLGRMKRPNYPEIVFFPIHGGKWSAAMETDAGLVSAVGDTQGEAQAQLNELLILARALEVTRRHEQLH